MRQTFLFFNSRGCKYVMLREPKLTSDGYIVVYHVHAFVIPTSCLVGPLGSIILPLLNGTASPSS